VVHRSYQFGPWLVGVRTNSEAVGEWLEWALAEYASDEETDPYFSIHVGDERGAHVRGYHILYRETSKLARTFDLAGVGRTFLTELESFLFAERDDALYADATIVASNGRFGLMPATTGLFVGSLGQRAVRKTGIVLSAETKVAIDPESGEVVPITSRLNVPEGAVERLAAIAPTTEPDGRVAVTRPLKIDTLFSVGMPDEPLLPVSPATAVYRMATHALNLHQLGSPGLEALHRLADDADCYEIKTANPKNMLSALTRGMHSDEAA
jgi:hypothetical protein